MSNKEKSRRDFIRLMSMSMGAVAIAPNIKCLSESQSNKDKLGIALVGLGGYSSGQLAPALQETKNCYLAGIVTGTPAKEKLWSDRYNIPKANIYNYNNFDSIAQNPAIDIVYIVLPVGMHKEFTIRGAKAGKHVICEKPMEVNVQNCQDMIDACKAADRKLSLGYRLHFEPYNKEMMRLGQKQVYGKVIEIDCANGYTYGGDPNNWRVKKALAGGGGLMDMGVYCIQATRYVTGEEPSYVTAREEKTRPEVFREVDETIFFELEFPSGCVARCESSYNKNLDHLKVKAEKGEFGLTRAFRYGGQAGYTSKGELELPHINQQAAQMDDFAECILKTKETIVPGAEGLKDMRVIEAIYRSIASGKREKI